MLRVSKRAEYGLIATAALAVEPGVRMSVRTLSERYTLPQRLLAEVMKVLQHGGLVEGQRGVNGGYRLSVPAEKLTVRRVFRILEGPLGVAQCSVGEFVEPSFCEQEQTCPIHDPINRIHSEIDGLLARMTVGEMARPAQEARA